MALDLANGISYLVLSPNRVRHVTRLRTGVWIGWGGSWKLEAGSWKVVAAWIPAFAGVTFPLSRE